MRIQKHLLVVILFLSGLAPLYANITELSVPPVLIKAQLSNNLESGAVAPLIGAVSEDVVIDGNVLIPANSEIHGMTQAQAFHNRITCATQFIVVCPHNKFIVTGTVLERDDTKSDGSYGLLGVPVDLYGGFVRVDAGHKFYLYAQGIAKQVE